MVKKIILFLSELKPNVKETTYICPDGCTVGGIQTNEAPVLYLLHKYPDVTEVLCIVTPIALATAWERFEGVVQAAYPKVKLVQIPFEESQDFDRDVLPIIIKRVQPGDTILLETTGGFRNAVMHLLLLSRALSYIGICTQDAVYSNFNVNPKRIESVSHLVDIFELVGGMQELSSFGSVQTLRTYYSKRPKDKKIDALLTAMERLNEAIMLCRTGELLEKRIVQFNSALEEAQQCSDPLMRALLPAFQAKFGKRLTTPGLIKWCVESNMLQQALTIYKEKIPEYIMKRGNILTVKESAPKPEHIKNYQNEYEARFFEHLIQMGNNVTLRDLEEDARYRISGNQAVKLLEHLDELLPRSYFTTSYSISQIQNIIMDYLYIRILRNMINHANEQTLDTQHALLDYLADYRYKRPEDVSLAEVKRVLLRSLDHLQPSPKKGKK